MAALRQNAGDGAGESDSLEALVARIQAGDRSTLGPPPSPEAIARLVARIENEPVMSPEEQGEWDKEWDAVMVEIHARERADDIAEGRG